MPIQINRQITSRAHVEATRAETEGETLDYKKTYDPKNWPEAAKDMAAFANHLGGVILLGADEDAQGSPMLLGLPPEIVTVLSETFYDAALKRCRPSTLISCARIPWDCAREMLAVNVQAYAGGIVGAQFGTQNKNGKWDGANAWRFLRRVGKDNVDLPLEQATMHMSAHARRVAILLSQIDRTKRIKLGVGDPTYIPDAAKLGDFSIEENTVRVTLVGAQPFGATVHAVPFEDIGAVWKDVDGTWCVHVAGKFEHIIFRDNSHRVLYRSRAAVQP